MHGGFLEHRGTAGVDSWDWKLECSESWPRMLGVETVPCQHYRHQFSDDLRDANL